jgi:hypothetical protein
MKQLTSDCTPEPAEGIFWHPGPPGGRVLMPAAVVVAGGFPSDPAAPPRCKALRMAMISRARDEKYQPKPGSPSSVAALLADGFWDRITIEATVIHLALPRNDAAVTIDVVARFKDGKLALLAVWPQNTGELINHSAPWAELGAGVAAAADRGLIVDKVGLIWAGEQGCKLEAADPNKALGLWCDAVDLHRFHERRKLAVAA